MVKSVKILASLCFFTTKKFEDKNGKSPVQFKLTQQPSVTSACKSQSVLLLPCQRKRASQVMFLHQRKFEEKVEKNWGEPHSNLINAIMTYYSPPWCSPLFCRGKEQILNTINLERVNCSLSKVYFHEGKGENICKVSHSVFKRLFYPY